MHSWGPTLEKAFEQCAISMFGYMTDLDTIEESSTLQIEAAGHDLQSVLYNFLDEWLFNFSADPFFIPFKIEVTEFDRSQDEIRIKAIGYGETFDLDKHPQGTEVKAITYSAMQITEKDSFCETFVIVDI